VTEATFLRQTSQTQIYETERNNYQGSTMFVCISLVLLSADQPIRANTRYALQLRKAELEIARLQNENFELRVQVADMRAKVARMGTTEHAISQAYKELVESKSSEITDIVRLLWNAVDSMNSLLKADFTRFGCESTVKSKRERAPVSSLYISELKITLISGSDGRTRTR
jgi:hypothetical protein